MGRYAVEMKRTASTSLPVGSIVADATRPRRFKLYELVVGSEATPADNVFLWLVKRCTAAGTSTAVTPVALDPADAATEMDAGENHTVDATQTANSELLEIPLNQRATFRWIAAPGGEIVAPATASNGLAFNTPTASGLVAVTALAHVEEQ